VRLLLVVVLVVVIDFLFSVEKGALQAESYAVKKHEALQFSRD